MLRPKLVVPTLPRRLKAAPPSEWRPAAATKLPPLVSEALPLSGSGAAPQRDVELGPPAPVEPTFRRIVEPTPRKAAPQRPAPPKASELPALAAAGLLRPGVPGYEGAYALAWELRPDLLVKLLTKAEYFDPDVNPLHVLALGAPGRRSRQGIPNIDYST